MQKILQDFILSPWFLSVPRICCIPTLDSSVLLIAISNPHVSALVPHFRLPAVHFHSNVTSMSLFEIELLIGVLENEPFTPNSLFPLMAPPLLTLQSYLKVLQWALVFLPQSFTQISHCIWLILASKRFMYLFMLLHSHGQHSGASITLCLKSLTRSSPMLGGTNSSGWYSRLSSIWTYWEEGGARTRLDSSSIPLSLMSPFPQILRKSPQYLLVYSNATNLSRGNLTPMYILLCLPRKF